MDYPLSRMRDYTINGREIIEEGDYLIFGDKAFHKSCKTNFLMWNQKDYYTLESVYFFLKNRSLVHTSYVKEAAARELQVVIRPDRKPLEDYLTNEKLETAPTRIDCNAPFCNFVLVDELRSVLPCPSEPPPTEQESKRPRINVNFCSFRRRDLEEVARKERLFAMLGKGSTAEQDSKLTEPIRELSKDLGLTADKIAALRSKALARKRTQIQTIEDDLEELPTVGIEGEAPVEEHVEKSTELITEEIVYVNRNSILMAATKDILAVIKPAIHEVEKIAKTKMEKVRVSKEVQISNDLEKRGSQPAYSRYDQDRFKKSVTEDFNIDTKRTFTVPVVESAVADRLNGPNSTHLNASHGKMSASMSAVRDDTIVGRPSKRSSRIPIIVIPSTTSSLVTLYNARELLENLRYASSDEAKTKGARRDNEILIHRRRENGTSSPFRIVNNPLRFTNDEWYVALFLKAYNVTHHAYIINDRNRVVAVFVQGPAWQFKGWPLGTNPPDIFTKVCAFHLKWEDDKLDSNVSRWAVNILTLSRTKRHLDRACLHKFWETLDR
ncbi:parafibromin [Trichuris trichiura]|uniref:Parafibromin n=1 Tax=Trichuris trichiura TaxID=36087 RepID=A0A077ZEQ5_TRITR|nr:parafibromin [Trichuris trichiura]